MITKQELSKFRRKQAKYEARRKFVLALYDRELKPIITAYIRKERDDENASAHLTETLLAFLRKHKKGKAKRFLERRSDNTGIATVAALWEKSQSLAKRRNPNRVYPVRLMRYAASVSCGITEMYLKKID